MQALVAVDVEARVLKPEALETRVTNTFTFSFRVETAAGRKLQSVLPASEEEVERLRAYLADHPELFDQEAAAV